MRRLTNKTIDAPLVRVVWQADKVIENTLIGDSVSYFKLYETAVKTAPAGGWKQDDIYKLKGRLDLMGKIKADAKTLLLEEDEYELLKTCVKENISLFSTDTQTLEFYEYLPAVPRESINEKTKSLKK